MQTDDAEGRSVGHARHPPSFHGILAAVLCGDHSLDRSTGCSRFCATPPICLPGALRTHTLDHPPAGDLLTAPTRHHLADPRTGIVRVPLVISEPRLAQQPLLPLLVSREPPALVSYSPPCPISPPHPE